MPNIQAKRGQTPLTGEVTHIVRDILRRVERRFRRPDSKSLVWLNRPQLKQEGWGAEATEQSKVSLHAAAPAWIFRR